MSTTQSNQPDDLDVQIAEWRAYLLRRREVHAVDVDELEDHLRNEVSALVDARLSEEEAFLVSVKRIGEIDSLTREFAREHSERLWKQLVRPETASGELKAAVRTEAIVVVALAVVAAIAAKVPLMFGLGLADGTEGSYLRNVSLFVLPPLTGYFAWKRRLPTATCALAGLAFVVAAVLVNLLPFESQGANEILAILHLPIALWLVVGIAYTGGKWSSSAHRMNFVRFSGELLIYYVLIALGGGVLTGFTMGMFHSIGLDAEWLAQTWLLPCGAAGALIVAAWLVEAKQSVIENMAPVLTRLFTPLLTAVLLAFLGTMAWTRHGIDVERDVLIGFDLLLVLVLGLLLYSVSARNPQAKPDGFDALQLLLVLCALVVDAVALTAITARISEFGFSANKVAALGENLILLVNLSWSAWLYARLLRGQGAFSALERWQTSYLPVYAIWAAFVVVAFPPLFGFV